MDQGDKDALFLVWLISVIICICGYTTDLKKLRGDQMWSSMLICWCPVVNTLVAIYFLIKGLYHIFSR